MNTATPCHGLKLPTGSCPPVRAVQQCPRGPAAMAHGRPRCTQAEHLQIKTLYCMFPPDPGEGRQHPVSASDAWHKATASHLYAEEQARSTTALGKLCPWEPALLPYPRKRPQNVETPEGEKETEGQELSSTPLRPGTGGSPPSLPVSFSLWFSPVVHSSSVYSTTEAALPNSRPQPS